MDLGSAAIAERKGQGLPLLLRSASGLSGRFAARRIRVAARAGCGLRVPASELVAGHAERPGDFGRYGGLLDELRQVRRSERAGRSAVAVRIAVLGEVRP